MIFWNDNRLFPCKLNHKSYLFFFVSFLRKSEVLHVMKNEKKKSDKYLKAVYTIKNEHIWNVINVPTTRQKTWYGQPHGSNCYMLHLKELISWLSKTLLKLMDTSLSALFTNLSSNNILQYPPFMVSYNLH